MFLNDRNSADRIRAQRILFSLWMAVAAIAVIATMTAGLATSAKAEQSLATAAGQNVDPLTTAAIAPAASMPHGIHRDLIFGVVLLTGLAMAAGGLVLTRSGLRDTMRQHRKPPASKPR